MRAAAGASRSRADCRGTDAPLIEVEHLTKCYGALRAVDDVSFAVGRGEIAALLGPNGSGKSTLMRCLIGFFSPTAGRARVAGIDVGERAVEARRQIGYLPEQVALYPELSVERYLRFVAGVKGLDGGARRAAVADVMARCGLADTATRATGKLSRGYRQRVGLAQALLGEPEVLVLDEPTVGLDPVQTVEMRALVRNLADRTVLLSTHILSEAAALCSRVVILDKGRLVAVDTPADLTRRVERAGRLLVRIEGPSGEIQAMLAGLPGARAVEPMAPGEGPGHAFAVVAPDPEPAQRALGAAVVARGWVLLEMRVQEPTLEDLFMQLVG